MRPGHRELRELLELLHDPPDRPMTLEAQYRDWLWPEPSPLVVVRTAGNAGRPANATALHWAGAGPFPRSVETRRRIWMIDPDRLKVEVMRGRQVTRLAVRDRARWWRWDHLEGVDSADEDQGDLQLMLPPMLEPVLFSPWRVLARFRLEDVGEGQRAGREVLTAHARPRRTYMVGEPDMRYELEFDARYGTMLRLAAFGRERCVQATEAITIAYDHELDPLLFRWPARSTTQTVD